MRAGAPRVNPSGRPAGSAGVAELLRELTGDYRRICERLVRMSDNVNNEFTENQQRWATEIILDRGLGRPMQSSEIHAQIAATVAPAGPQLPDGWLDLDERKREAWLNANLPPRALPPGTP